jgi:hypothetical protein
MLQQSSPPLSPALQALRVKQGNSTIRIEILRRLLEMNISYATVFPGLDGFAQSLKHEAEFVSEPAGDVSDAGGYYPQEF